MKTLFPKVIMILAATALMAGCGGKDKPVETKSADVTPFFSAVSYDSCYVGTADVMTPEQWEKTLNPVEGEEPEDMTKYVKRFAVRFSKTFAKDEAGNDTENVESYTMRILDREESKDEQDKVVITTTDEFVSLPIKSDTEGLDNKYLDLKEMSYVEERVEGEGEAQKTITTNYQYDLSLSIYPPIDANHVMAIAGKAGLRREVEKAPAEEGGEPTKEMKQELLYNNISLKQSPIGECLTSKEREELIAQATIAMRLALQGI